MRSATHVLAVAMVLGAGLAGLPRPASAEMFVYTAKDGTKTFTNVPPPSAERRRWRKLQDFGPGKAAVISGTSSAGCKASRADVVPATDKSPDRYVRYDAIIAEAARIYGLPEALIRAVIKVESDYDPRVVSCAGAKGLMQVMPYEETSEHIADVFDPRQNILAGARMLRTKANRWNGSLDLTIAAYHAGSGAVSKYKGIPPYATTQQYVQWVRKQYERYRQKELAQAGAPIPPG